MSMVISIPRILQVKLGHDGADALAETLNKVEESHKNNILAVAEERFERRLTEVKDELRQEMGEIRVEIADSRSEIIKWMFLFWAGQLTVTTGLFFAFLK